jgi:hypothetical protein
VAAVLPGPRPLDADGREHGDVHVGLEVIAGFGLVMVSLVLVLGLAPRLPTAASVTRRFGPRSLPEDRSGEPIAARAAA